jgi:peptidoglycan/xylan/chitin deacetylase (PgdA/CDA1 family)
MTKSFKLLIAVAVIAAIVTLMYPSSKELLQTVRSHAYPYAYTAPELRVADVAQLPPAEAVPILMYHGVIARGGIGPNTSRKNFIDQMEMLKREGYETITVDEYDRFRHGLFVLPPKPIIITFDDGRKDSFYTVDEIFKALGFKGTMFVATVRANQNDPFYLNWEELKLLQASGRWEIEAHGRRSHDNIPKDAEGNTGSFLVTLEYKDGRMETIDEFRARIAQDYEDGNRDLKERLGIDAHYFAVPLNHYGKLEESNFDGALNINVELTRQYFRLAFIEALSDSQARESFYNYPDTDPVNIKRLEVKNMTADDLKISLDRYAPQVPEMHFVEENAADIKEDTLVLYGTSTFARGVTLSAKEMRHSARLLFADWSWKNYVVNADISRDAGKSVSLHAYYVDEFNYLSFDWSDTSVRLVEHTNGIERQLGALNVGDVSRARMTIEVSKGVVRASFNEASFVNGARTTIPRGAVGLSVWDPVMQASATVHAMDVTPLSL